ncbi:MAG: hypothetical protein ACI8RD_011948, partial [Bacillariaceae sp.]
RERERESCLPLLEEKLRDFTCCSNFVSITK